MAIRLLSPSSGKTSIAPLDNYANVVSRYAAEIKAAMLEQENADIRRMSNSLDKGEITFKEYQTFINGVISKYPADSSRAVLLEEAVVQGRVNSIRNQDLRGQNADLEKFGSGGLSDGEVRTMHLNRINRLRKLDTAKYDPELWNSALGEYTDYLTKISEASTSRSKDQLSQDLSRRMLELTNRYEDPEHPNPISGAAYDSQMGNLYRQAQDNGILTNEGYQSWLNIQSRQRLRETNDIVDLVSTDPKTGYRTVSPVTTSTLTDRYSVESFVDTDNKTKSRIFDKLSGDYVGRTFGDKESAVAEEEAYKLNTSSFGARDPNGNVTMFNFDPAAKGADGKSGAFTAYSGEPGQPGSFKVMTQSPSGLFGQSETKFSGQPREIAGRGKSDQPGFARDITGAINKSRQFLEQQSESQYGKLVGEGIRRGVEASPFGTAFSAGRAAVSGYQQYGQRFGNFVSRTVSKIGEVGKRVLGYFGF